jgi:hypothetical protein
MLPFVLACTLAAPAEISAAEAPLRQIAELRIEYAEPEHSHSEQETGMMEYAFIDVTSPVVTGGLIQSQPPPVILEVANRAMKEWWEGTRFGRRFVLADVLRHYRNPVRRFRRSGRETNT